MWQTIFVIPDQLGPLPVFGWGWALIVWAVASGLSIWIAARKHGWSQASASLPFLLIVAAAIVFLLPMLQVERILPDGTRQFGLAVRGYGVMLLVAVVAGVSLAVRRGERRGISSDRILSLATWMFALGILGARSLYIGLNWDVYGKQGLPALIGGFLNLSQGGLVVYGSFIGAMLAFVLFVKRHKISPLVLADIVAPSLLLGLAIGRIGCFLNGCCYGGPSEHAWAVRFPQESVPYSEQLRDGSLHGFGWQQVDKEIVIVRLIAESQLAQGGLAVGDKITRVNGRSVSDPGMALADRMAGLVELAGPQITLTTTSGRDVASALERLPGHTTPLHPTQLYSSITAFLLLGFLLAAEPFLTKPGQLFALLITLYPVGRFLLEVIRTDEGSFGSTGLTVSQNISVLLIVVAVGLWIYLNRQQGDSSLTAARASQT